MNDQPTAAAMSQATIIGLPQPKSWGDYEHGCLSTFSGGHDTPETREAFRHGMTTVFNLLRAEFPPAEQCKSVPLLIEACRAAQARYRSMWFCDGASPHSKSRTDQEYRLLTAALAAAEKDGGA